MVMKQVGRAKRGHITFFAWGLLVTAMFGLAPSAHAVEAWSEFRGPHGDGDAGTADLPLRWSESEGVTWKTAIHGRGWSSPVIWGEQIWLTTATEDGKQMFALCVDRNDGHLVHDLLVFENAEPRFCHPTNSYASPTPVVDAEHVYVHFGSYGTACLNRADGQTVWQRRDLECDHWRGPGASPILHDGMLYVSYDGFDVQYVVAFDAATGNTVWRRDRAIDYGSDNGDFKKAYCTAQVIEHDGRQQLISPSAAETIAYDPKTGDELWRVRHGGMNTATRPVYGHGLVYITVGDSVGPVKPTILAVRPGGSGNVTATHVAWSLDKTAPKRPSPLLIGNLLFTLNDDGVAMCLDAMTGETIWRERIGGNFRASPIHASGRIYLCNLEGDTTVIEAGEKYVELAVNHLDHGFQASPAVQGDSLFLRSTTHLYRIDKP